MGWGGGTDIFDEVAQRVEFLFNSDDIDFEYQEIAEDVLYSLKSALFKKDWDTVEESNYWDHPVVGKILGNEFEEDDE